MSGNKTHEQQIRQFERKPDVPKTAHPSAHPEEEHGRAPRDEDARESEHLVSRRGMNQESRQHNKHNDPEKDSKS